jgi:hypothetical protein
VTKQLPHNGREFEYRIKSANEEHERVAGENELIRHKQLAGKSQRIDDVVAKVRVETMDANFSLAI